MNLWLCFIFILLPANRIQENLKGTHVDTKVQVIEMVEPGFLAGMPGLAAYGVVWILIPAGSLSA